MHALKKLTQFVSLLTKLMLQRSRRAFYAFFWNNQTVWSDQFTVV